VLFIHRGIREILICDKATNGFVSSFGDTHLSYGLFSFPHDLGRPGAAGYAGGRMMDTPSPTPGYPEVPQHIGVGKTTIMLECDHAGMKSEAHETERIYPDVNEVP
jgi:hypothetical protein